MLSLLIASITKEMVITQTLICLIIWFSILTFVFVLSCRRAIPVIGAFRVLSPSFIFPPLWLCIMIVAKVFHCYCYYDVAPKNGVSVRDV